MQLFVKLLNATEHLLQSYCHIGNIWDIVRCIIGQPIFINALHYAAEHTTN